MYKFMLILCTFLICHDILKADDSTHHYKISMVSSGEGSSQPALFQHAESPVWDIDTQSLLFVDVHQQNVHQLDYTTGVIRTKHIDYGQVNVVLPVADSKRLLVAVRSAMYLLDWNVSDDAALRLLVTVDEGLPDNVINDGKADAKGRFWAGTKGPQTGDDVDPDKALFFSIEQESFTHPRVHLMPVTISNGLAWSLNNTVLYYIDSPTQKVEAFDYDLNTGTINGRRTIIDISNYGYEDAIPDGMTIDSDGHLWVAIIFGGVVLRIDPDRRQIVHAYKLPVSKITSVCWGGPNLDELFVTSSKDSQEPLSGAIFTIRGTGSRGVPSYPFRFDDADKY